jgi:hypothetical protein
VNVAETHETIHWESGMRYQMPSFTLIRRSFQPG